MITLIHGRPRAHRDKYEICPSSIGDLQNVFSRVLFIGIQYMGGPELSGNRQFFIFGIQGNDADGPAQPGSLHRVQADSPHTDDHHRGTGVDPCSVYHSTDPRDHATGQQRRRIQPDISGQYCDLGGINHHVFRKCPRFHALNDRVAPGIRQNISRIQCHRGITQGGSILIAIEATAAGPDQGHNHPVAFLETFHVCTHFHHNPRCLVPVYSGQRAFPGPFCIVDIRMADGTCANFYFHLGPFRFRNVDVLN